MTIKLIAVDMDGTFVNDKMTYNRDRFKQLFEKMQEKEIHFVGASGNPLPQLRKYFSEITDKMTFIAENGAYIVENGQEIDSSIMDWHLVEKVRDVLKRYSDVPFVMCGKKSAYVHEEIADDYYHMFRRYYPLLEKVSSLENLDDEIFKFATAFEESQVTHVLDYLHGELVGEVTPVSSGYGFVDLMQPNINKGRGIKLLQERWGVTKEESAAFGDSPNDLEMLQEVGFSFAMENATDEVKRASKKVIGSNNTESLLDTIEELIERA